MWFGPIIWILLLVLGVWLAMGLMRRNGVRVGRDPESGSIAREILDRRFARGEIDEEEYRRRRAIIGS